jgi:isopropylmalate/homocitrate/citramalate synthase
MGKKSGIDSVEIWADKMGIEITREQGKEILTRVKKLASEVRRTLTEEEFREICRDVKTEGR